MVIKDILTITGSALAIIGVGITLFKTIRNWRIKRRQERDLSIFFGEDKNVFDYRKNFIRTIGVDRPPDDEDDYEKTEEFANKEDLIDFFIKRVFSKRAKQFFLVLGDAGMGKTTFLVNLYLLYSRKIIGRKFKIRFVALGDPYADEYIEKCKKDGSFHDSGGNTILLLDSFDEDPKAKDDYAKRLNSIIHNCRTFSKVIITSRTQFFPEESKEKFSDFIPLSDKNTSYLTVAKKYIAPFSDKEKDKYLRKKYSWKFPFFGHWLYMNSKRKIAEEICDKATNLTARPMLLDNIDIIIEQDKPPKYESEIYQILIDSWVKRESKKQKSKHPDEGKFIKDMNLFIEEAARICYLSYRKGDGLFIDFATLDRIANDLSIDLDVVDVKARSLLNRNSKGRYKFSHKTILEFLLAKFDLDQVQPHKFINFESFDFGLYIRNQIGFLNLNNEHKPVFLMWEGTFHFKPYKTTLKTDGASVKKILAINYDTFSIRKIHYFQNLKEIYLLDELPAYIRIKDIETIEFVVNSGLNIFTRNHVYALNISVSIVPYDDYFRDSGILCQKVVYR